MPRSPHRRLGSSGRMAAATGSERSGANDRLRSGDAVTEALGPDLYAGTSGVALFLAEAGRRLDEPRFRATALRAIRLALEQAVTSRRPTVCTAAAPASA